MHGITLRYAKFGGEMVVISLFTEGIADLACIFIEFVNSKGSGRSRRLTEGS